MDTLQFTTESKNDIKDFMWGLELNPMGKIAEVVDIRNETTKAQIPTYVVTLHVLEDEDVNLTTIRYTWLKGFISGFELRTWLT